MHLSSCCISLPFCRELLTPEHDLHGKNLGIALPSYIIHHFLQKVVNMPYSEKVLVEHWGDRTNTSSPDEVEDDFVVISDEATAEWVYFLLFLIHHSCRVLFSDTFLGR